MKREEGKRDVASDLREIEAAVSAITLGEDDRHGAAPTTAMTHIAIQEQLDGKVVDWLEKVSDEQYGQ
jgi:hypothetical protein